MGFRFKLKLLRSVDLALKNVIREGGLPERLRCKKLNGEYDPSKCEDCARNEREAERGAIWEQGLNSIHFRILKKIFTKKFTKIFTKKLSKFILKKSRMSRI